MATKRVSLTAAGKKKLEEELEELLATSKKTRSIRQRGTKNG